MCSTERMSGQPSPGVEHNWAGNHAYPAAALLTPRTTGELREIVRRKARVKALGSRHTFTDIADPGELAGEQGVQITLDHLPEVFAIDEDTHTVRVGGGSRYGDIAARLHERGWALANLASLPHISVAGAVATGSHGSGDGNRSLASSVAALTIVDGLGEVRVVRRGDPGFDGVVVGLGVLGIVIEVTLDIEPTYDVRQDVFLEVPAAVVDEHFDELTASGYSVSLFTDFSDGGLRQVWVKSRGADGPRSLFGAQRADVAMHPLAGMSAEAATEQGGVPGPWSERLAHFRMAFTPSHGAELQSEYLVPREQAREALESMRALHPLLAPVLLSGELRTVAAEELWLGPAYGGGVIGFHLTLTLDEPAVYAVLPAIEAALLPLGARPHWGKCFVATAEQLRRCYPRFDDFLALRRDFDPTGRFTNSWTGRVLGV